MKRSALLITLVAALILSACGSESKLPVATGKANIRAINGVKTAPDVDFLIEERRLGSVGYRAITSNNSYDDLEYNFNFDVLFGGELQRDRVASMLVDIVRDLDYIFVLTGTLADPSILLWETEERDFAGTETVFEARFAHTAASLGSVDYYFAAPGIDPLLGEQAGTLAFGDVLPSIDFEAGEYVLTITANGMPDQVLYESGTTTFIPATQYIVSSFDGDANTFAPVVGRAFTSSFDSGGGAFTMPDINYPPNLELVNGSLAIGTVDIYDDALLSSQIVADHEYRDVSAELVFSSGENSILYTPTTLLSPVLIDQVITLFTGMRGRVVAFGPLDALELKTYIPDRRTVETQAKLGIFNAAINFGFLNIYVVDADTAIGGILPTRGVLPSGNRAAIISLAEGSFDIYVTRFDAEEILAGPIRIDVEYGDVLDAIIFDTVDTAVLDFIFLPINP
jgi:hypothetical protein